jgi:hypothetical protein
VPKYFSTQTTMLSLACIKFEVNGKKWEERSEWNIKLPAAITTDDSEYSKILINNFFACNKV